VGFHYLRPRWKDSTSTTGVIFSSNLWLFLRQYPRRTLLASQTYNQSTRISTITVLYLRLAALTGVGRFNLFQLFRRRTNRGTLDHLGTQHMFLHTATQFKRNARSSTLLVRLYALLFDGTFWGTRFKRVFRKTTDRIVNLVPSSHQDQDRREISTREIRVLASRLRCRHRYSHKRRISLRLPTGVGPQKRKTCSEPSPVQALVTQPYAYRIQAIQYTFNRMPAHCPEELLYHT